MRSLTFLALLGLEFPLAAENRKIWQTWNSCRASGC